MVRVLVTGGSGFIGMNLCLALEKAGIDWVNFDVKKPIKAELVAKTIIVDIENFPEMSLQLRSYAPTHVFHLAARTDLNGKSLEDYRVNTQGVRNLILALSDLPVKLTKSIYFSSRLVFDIQKAPSSDFDYSATTLYGKSKIEMEKIIRTKASEVGPWTIVRPTSIWGPWFETPYRDFFTQIQKQRFFKIVGQNPKKSFGYVENLVHKVLLIGLEKPELFQSKAVWLADNTPLSLNEWADMIADRMGVSRARSVNYSLLRMVARGGDLLKLVGIKFPLTTFRLRNMTANMVYDTEGWKDLGVKDPVTVSEGVSRTISWIEDNED